FNFAPSDTLYFIATYFIVSKMYAISYMATYVPLPSPPPSFFLPNPLPFSPIDSTPAARSADAEPIVKGVPPPKPTSNSKPTTTTTTTIRTSSI
ncbi:hypothetical protein H0H93_007676, partial [Arthromyces matolae]